MEKIDERLRQCGAEFIAKLALRYRKVGNEYDASRAVNRLVDVLEASPKPDRLLDRIVRKLGRDQALVLGVEDWAIDRVFGSS